MSYININNNKIGKNFLEKHLKYKKQYEKNELYWGIGIENETYLEFSKKLTVSKNFFLENHKAERYSVSYYRSYLEDRLDDIFSQYYFLMKKTGKDIIELPLLINSHTFDETDQYGESRTLYAKGSPPNSKFCGKTLDQAFREHSSYFSEQFDKNFTYDGDTIEFITQQFYKTTIEKCVEELIDAKERWIDEIQDFFPVKEYGKVQFMKENHPFAIHLTNKNNVSMFNNGTYHFNFTLPTRLNQDGKIEDEEKFISDHCKAIRMLQLFSPIFLCIYGTPDPFSKVNDTFSKASQRCAVSRYISIGTYDTEKMKKGKILTVPTKNLEVSKLPYWWFNQFHSHSSYSVLKDIGMDINFNKHYFHGIEFRMFEYFPEEHLEDLLAIITYLFDVALDSKFVENFVMTEEWNNMTAKCMRYGKDSVLTSSELFLFEKVLQKPIHACGVANVYNEITSILLDRYKKGGPASKYMLGLVDTKEIKDTKEMEKGFESLECLKISNMSEKTKERCCIVL